MELNILATGSSGNCAILNDNGHELIIDCGINFDTIVSNEHFNGFKGCEKLLVTHSHKDHSKALNDMSLTGVDILDTSCEARKLYNTQNYAIFPFLVKHSVICQGFVIMAKNSKIKLFWATDFSSTPIIQDCDVYCIEVNYDVDIINKRVCRGERIESKFQYHHSLQDAIKFFQQLRHKPKMIVALHGSRQNLNSEKVVESLSGYANKVIVAKKDLQIFL